MSSIMVAHPTAHAVWAIAAERSAAPATRARALAAHLVDSSGRGRDRDLGAYRAWRNDTDLIDVAVTGAELPLQLASLTVHEATPELAGPGLAAADSVVSR
jgi:hypothetical protein